MTGPREPPVLDDAAIGRMWSGITSRRRSRARRRQALAAASGIAVIAMVAAAVFRPSRFTSWNQVASVTPPEAQVAPSSGPVHLAEGALADHLVATDKPQHFKLDDGSVVDLASSTSLETRANTSTAFTVYLKGTATFEVKPGGPRRWSIVSDLLTVDVIGTRFDVIAEPFGERVVVEHGIVLVRGERVPNRVQRLVDGQSLRVSSAPPVLELPPDSPAPPPPPSPAVLSPPRATAPSPTWKDLARTGDYEGAYRQLGPDGLAIQASRASVDDLLALADIARLSAHADEAVAPLSRVVDEHPSDARAAVAAFTLGRLELDTLNHPAKAAKAFARSIALHAPGGLVEDAYARLVEADVKAGDRDAARAVAREYAEKYPQGTRSSTMARWIAGTPERH
jgi:transmembrane sensor